MTLTAVVVWVWDRRRVMLPLTNVVETPLQNWIRASADLIGSLFLDRTPVGAVRDELRRIVEASAHWEGTPVPSTSRTQRSAATNCG